jgi:hypothetical protein
LITDFVEIARLIAKFQSIETSLKVVLVLDQIEKDKKNNINDKLYSLDEVDDLPYGVLLKRYAKVSQNQELSDRLRALKDYRNFLAHKSLLSVSNMPQYLKEFVGVYLDEPIDYKMLNQELDECISIFCKQHGKGKTN